MARGDAPPFERGSTFFNGATKDPVFSDPLNYLGKEYEFEPDSDGGSLTDIYGRQVVCRIVQNTSGVALLPGLLAHYAAGDPMDCKVDGYTDALADRPAGVIDEFLPPAGVPNNDLFFIVVDGPTQVKVVTTGLTNIAAGDNLVPATGTNRTTSADAGRVNKQDITGATGTLANNIQNLVGQSEQAQTVVNTLTKIVIHRRYK